MTVSPTARQHAMDDDVGRRGRLVVAGPEPTRAVGRAGRRGKRSVRRRGCSFSAFCCPFAVLSLPFAVLSLPFAVLPLLLMKDEVSLCVPRC